MLELSSFEELAGYVHGILVHRGDLDDSTPMADRTLVRGKQPVGVEYTLLAPRAVRLSAVWSAIEGRILFYDAELSRFQATAVHGPPIDAIMNRPRLGGQVKSLWTGK